MNNISEIISNLRLLYIKHNNLPENSHVLQQELSLFIGLKSESLSTYKARNSIPYPAILTFCREYSYDPLIVFFDKNGILCVDCGCEITNDNQVLNGGYIRGRCKKCFTAEQKKTILKSRAKKLEKLTHCSKKDCGVFLDESNTVFITRKNKDGVPVTKKSTVCKVCTQKRYEKQKLKNLKTVMTCESCGKTKTEKSFTLNTTDMIVCNTCFKYKASYKSPVKKKVVEKKPVEKKTPKKIQELPPKKCSLDEVPIKKEEKPSFIRKNTKEEEDMIARFLANKK